MARVLRVLGQDLSQWVVEYGDLQEVKEALLSKAELFSGEVELVLDNSTGRFLPDGPIGLFRTGGWYNGEVELEVDGEVLFRGFLKSLDTGDSESKTMTLACENVLARGADRAVSTSMLNANPAMACRSILVAAGLGEYLDERTFVAAAQAAQAAGAVINLDLTDSDQTALSVVSTISDLCSLSIIANGSTIRCQAFQPYQGAGAGLRQEITPALARGFGNAYFDREAFANEVIFKWGTAQTLTLVNEQSRARDRGLRSTSVSAEATGKIGVPDLGSANYFAALILARSSYRRQVVSCVLDDRLKGIRVGDRHPVTNPVLGLSQTPCEVIEVVRRLTQNEVEVKLVSLSAV